ncbi:MAG TPA: hypothetical protein VGI39_09615 [Polyangiaceae bacterium]|jgi:hypothetical protein
MERHGFPRWACAWVALNVACGSPQGAAPADGSSGTIPEVPDSSAPSEDSGEPSSPSGGDDAGDASIADAADSSQAPVADAMTASCATWLGTAGATSQWVHVDPNDPNGKLVYRTMPQGDRILDFSSAGYMGGGVALPTVPAGATVSPAGGTADDTAAIQAAIQTVSALPLTGGFRGAVVLAAGTFHVSAALSIKASGVVLRGSGSDANGTSLVMSGSPYTALTIAGSGSYATKGPAIAITDAYVPSGATSFAVSDASGFTAGDTVLIHRPVTAAWLALMGMDKLKNSSGQAQTWLGVGSNIDTDRTIASVSGDAITLDAPLSDSFDAKVLSPPGGTVAHYTFAGRITQVGVEHLRIVSPAVDVPIAMAQYSGISFDDVLDGWVSDVETQDTQNCFAISGRARRVTLDDARATHTVAHTGDMMADFSLSGTQTLVSRCSSTGTGSWPIVTQGRETGPIVVLHFTSDQKAGIAPHQRWATGLLADSCSLPNAPKGTPGIAFWDRGIHGSGQGWTVGWGVAWNVATPFLLLQQPPGSQNWCIGCQGASFTQAPAGSSATPPTGALDSLGTAVTPSSLYLAQLCERLGPQAVSNLGY